MRLIVKVKCVLILVLFGSYSFGQTQAKPSGKQLKSFDEIRNVKDARKFKKQNELLETVIFRTNSAKDTSDISKELYNRKVGDTFKRTDDQTSQEYTIKILEHYKKPTHRARYIFFDGKTMTKEAIDSLSNEILRQCKEGTPFSALADKHSMDVGNGGDLGWFGEGSMPLEFESAVKAHKVGDVFITEVEKKLWYYVVLKTHESVDAIWISAIQLKL